MEDNIDNRIIDLMKKDMRRDYTIPEIMKALEIKNREKIVASLARLEGQKQVEISPRKGRAKYYRIKNGLEKPIDT